MVLSSCVTEDGWLTTFRISQKPIALFLGQFDQILGFGLGQRLATESNNDAIVFWEILNAVNQHPSTLTFDTRKMAPVDDTINNSRMQMDDMVPYHKFSNRTDQQVHDKLREKHFALAKGYYQLINELNHYKGRNSVQNSSIRGYQDSSISAALSERRSRLAKIEPIHQLSQRL